MEAQDDARQPIEKNVEMHYWPGGCSWVAVCFDHETERTAYWYGTRKECEEVNPEYVLQMLARKRGDK